MTLVNFLDIGGFVCGVVGVVLVGNINRWGYALLLLCNIGYGGLGYIQGNWGLFAVSIFMGVLDIYYFIKWTKALTIEKKCVILQSEVRENER